MKKYFSFQEPFPIFLLFPIFYFLFITSKKLLAFISSLIIIITCTLALIFENYKYFDCWVYIIICLVVLNTKLKIMENLTKYFSNKKKKLSKIEKSIYNQFYNHIISKEQFKYIFDKGKKVKVSSKYTFIKEGDLYDKIYFFVNVLNDKSLILSSKNITIDYLLTGDWIGTAEFLYFQKIESYDGQKWNISLNSTYNSEIIFYEWNVEKFKNMFLYSRDIQLLNKLLIIWNQQMSEKVKKYFDDLYNLSPKINSEIKVKSKEKGMASLISSVVFEDFNNENENEELNLLINK